jgi:predicted Zn-dependent protease
MLTKCIRLAVASGLAKINTAMRNIVALTLALYLCGVAQDCLAAVNEDRPLDRELDALFAALAHTHSAEDAKPIEEQILAKFATSGSPSIDLLMTRAAAALTGGDKNDARRIVNDVTIVAPDYAEGWHLKAKMQARDGDDVGAIVSFNKTVTLNPRQFEAYAELGSVLLSDGDKKDALVTLRKALSLDPHLGDIDREVSQLAREVEGEKI